jgi:hypothetical protein
MTDKSQNALCLDARDRLRERKRLTDAHIVALKNATSIPDEAREKMLALHLALTVADAKAGKRMTEFDRAYLAEHAPDALADVSTTYDRHRTAMRMKSREASKADQELGTIPKPKDPKRRAAALEDFGEFLNVYFRGEDRRFYAPFSMDHKQVIASAQHTVLTSDPMVAGMPRGSGKTSILELAPVWAILKCRWFFCPIIAATKGHSANILSSVKSVFTSPGPFADDFPDFCVPITAIEGEPRRCTGQRFHGDRTGIEWAMDHIRFAALHDIGWRDDLKGGIFWAAGLTSALRGLRLTLSDGTLVRPDACVFDDPQTDDSAASPTQTLKRLKILRGTIRFWAGPGKRIALLGAVTPVAVDDLAEKLLDSKTSGWRSIKAKSLKAFPSNMELWHSYQEKKHEEAALNETGLAAAHYADHREAMDAGAVISWPEKPVADGYASPLEELMAAYLEDPDLFMAEHQMEPRPASEMQSRFDPKALARKVNGRKRGEIPPSCAYTTAYIDTHDKALFWVIMGFEARRTPYVIDYGTLPEQPVKEYTLSNIRMTLRRKYPGMALEAAIYSGIIDLLTWLYNLRMPKGEYTAALDRVMADTGYMPDLWHQAKTLYPALTLTKGVGIKAGNRPITEWDHKPGQIIGDHWLQTRPTKREHPVVQVDTNHWKTVVADSCAYPPGHPAALTLYGDQRTVHSLFAGHIDAESFVETEGHGRKVVEWKQKPNRDNHWLDGVVGCFVGAAMLGARPDGAPEIGGKKKRKMLTQADLNKRRNYGAA